MTVINRTKIHHIIDTLPESVLAEVVRFLEFILFKLNRPLSLEDTEDLALAKAIEEGHTGERVSRAEIFEVLADRA